MTNNDLKLKIYICCSDKTIETVVKIKEFLEKNNCYTYFSDSLYIEELCSKIIKSDALIYILSDSNSTDLMINELDYAFQKGIDLIPVIISENYVIGTIERYYLSRKHLVSFKEDEENTNLLSQINDLYLKKNIYNNQIMLEDYIRLGNDKLSCFYALKLVEAYYKSYLFYKSNQTFYTLVESIYRYLVLSQINWAYDGAKTEKYFVSLKEIIKIVIEEYIKFNYSYSPENVLKIIKITNDVLFDYVFNEYGTSPGSNDELVNFQAQIIEKYPYLKDINSLIDKKHIHKKVFNNQNQELHSAVAQYLYKSNELFNLLCEQETQPIDFFSCLKMSYERLKEYCMLIGEKEIGAIAIEKIHEIELIIDSKELSQDSSLETDSLKAILGIKSKEQGEYDVFISHKSVDEEIAAKLYKFLKSNMLNPFFDKECLPKLGNAEYEEAILGALNNSKHFVIVLSNLEYLNSGWIKEEIDTFAQELREGRKNGNLLFLVTSNVMEEIIKTNKTCLPLKYRKFEIMTINEYRDKILSYLRDN